MSLSICSLRLRRRIRATCAFTTRRSYERILYSVFDQINYYWIATLFSLLHRTIDTSDKLGLARFILTRQTVSALKGYLLSPSSIKRVQRGSRAEPFPFVSFA